MWRLETQRAQSKVILQNIGIDKIRPQLLLFLLTAPIPSIRSSLLTSRTSLLLENGEDLTLKQAFLTSATTVWAFPQSSSIKKTRILLILTLPTPQLVSPPRVWSVSLYGSLSPSISLCSHPLIPIFLAPGALRQTPLPSSFSQFMLSLRSPAGVCVFF